MLEVNKSIQLHRILFDVGHPAHVHLFKNLAQHLIQNESKVLFTVRSKELETYLLEKENLPFIEIGKHGKSVFNKIIQLPLKNYRLFKIMRNYRPDIIISHGSFYAAQVGWFMRIPSITLEDTGNKEQIILYQFFTDVILSPQSLGKKISSKQIFYNSFHELAYINRIYVTNQNTSSKINKLILVRFVSWNASHDTSIKGFSDTQKIELVKFLQFFGTVYISSESKLPDSLQQFKLNTDPSDFHIVIKNSTLVISEGSTTAIESCLLGVPTIYLGNCSLGVMKYLIDKDVLFYALNMNDLKILINKIMEYDNAINQQRKIEKLYHESIDLTKLLIWIIDCYPNSIRLLRDNPEIQNKYIFN